MRRGLAAGLLIAFLWTNPVLARHTGCYYDAVDMHGYGCTDAEMRVIGALSMAEIAGVRGEFGEAWYWQLVAKEMVEGDPSIRLNPYAPIAHYQALDSFQMGTNVRFVVLPDRQLIIRDSLSRPIKIAGKWTTGDVGPLVDWLLAFAGGAVIGEAPGWVALTLGYAGNSLVLGSAGVGVSMGWSYTVDALPDAGETEYLVHLLHTLPDGRQQVYRANVRVKATGRLQVVAPWSLLGYRETGGGW